MNEYDYDDEKENDAIYEDLQAKKKELDRKKAEQDEKYYSRYLEMIPAEDIIRYLDMAMQHLQFIKSEKHLVRIIYRYALYFNHESSFLPFSVKNKINMLY